MARHSYTGHRYIGAAFLSIAVLSIFPFFSAGYASVPVLSSEIPSEKIAELYEVEDSTVVLGIPMMVPSTPPSQKKVALTFDADMTREMKRDLESSRVSSWYNKELINVLQKHEVKATLFVTGLWAETYPRETKELAKNTLFEIGNHSYDHHAYTSNCYHLPWISDDKDEEDIAKSQEVLTSILGRKPVLFRFPGLCHEDVDVATVSQHGLVTIDGDVTADDGFTHNTQKIIDEVLNNVKNGSIVVAHMNGGIIAPQTDEAIDIIIPALKARGYTFVTVSELLQSIK